MVKPPNQEPEARRKGYMELLRKSIFFWVGLSIFWFELALNLIFYAILIILVIGLLWISIFTAVSTSFLWLPMCLICAPLLMTVAILLR